MNTRLTIKLNNGVEMPMAGIGTFLLTPDEAEVSCISALASGCRLIVIPGSKNPAYIKDNFALFDFALTEDEMSGIAALDKGVRYYTSTPELLDRYVTMVPPVDEQK